jgi:hypothetical protein
MNRSSPRTTVRQQQETATRSSGRITPRTNFERACFATFLAAQKSVGGFGVEAAALRIAAERWPDDYATPLLLEQKAAVSGATTTDPTWAGPAAASGVSDYIASLAPISAAARLMNAGLRLSLDGQTSLLIPQRTGLPASDVAWVAEGQPAPVRRTTLSTTELGPPRKLMCEVVLTRELARHSQAEAVFTQLLKEDCALSLDAALFSAAAATTARPAGLLAGVTPIAAASGGGTSAMESDLGALAGAVAASGGSGEVIFVASPRQFAAVRIRAPQMPFEIVPSLALAAGTVVAIDAGAFVSGVGPDPEITASLSAVLHMEDASPLQLSTAGSPNVVAAPAQSMFQTASIALRLILDVSFQMRGSGLVQVVNSATWG